MEATKNKRELNNKEKEPDNSREIRRSSYSLVPKAVNNGSGRTGIQMRI